MYLMIFILLAVILFHNLPKYSRKITVFVSQYFYKVSDEELNLRYQVKDLRSEQDTINMTEEFAKYAKLQRKIDKYMAEIKQMSSLRQNKMSMVNIGVKVGIYVTQALTMLSLIITYRNDPLLVFPVEWFYPVHKLVAFPTGVPGGLGVTCWIIACSTAVNRVASLSSLGQSSATHSSFIMDRQPVDIPLD